MASGVLTCGVVSGPPDGGGDGGAFGAEQEVVGAEEAPSPPPTGPPLAETGDLCTDADTASGKPPFHLSPTLFVGMCRVSLQGAPDLASLPGATSPASSGLSVVEAISEPKMFTLRGFHDHVAANGTYIMGDGDLQLVNGKPAYRIQSSQDRWLCYVSSSDDWQIQTEELRGQVT